MYPLGLIAACFDGHVFCMKLHTKKLTWCEASYPKAAAGLRPLFNDHCDAKDASLRANPLGLIAHCSLLIAHC
jgi:hypothetical protein